MAYNYYPMGYQNYQQSQPGIIWVSGEAGARGYPVAPNTTVQLWDSEAQIIYLKSADASGMPSMKVLDYTIREQNSPVNNVSRGTDMSAYITREEFEKRLSELKEANHEQSSL